jgi:hypothetical protein
MSVDLYTHKSIKTEYTRWGEIVKATGYTAKE